MEHKYPYTDFNEYNLDWLIDRVKTLTNDWLETQEAWTGTQEEWTTLYNYVHDYFDNLDVQEEINNKLDEMAGDGSLLQVIENTVINYTGRTTEAWLNSHVVQETGYVLDSTLTIANAAAPAKTVGDALTDVNNALEYFEDGFGNYDLWYKAKLLYSDKYADVNGGHVVYTTNAYGVGTWLLEVEEGAEYTTYPNMRIVVPLQSDMYTATSDSAITNTGTIDLSNYPNTKYLAISLEGITSVKISKGDTVKEGYIYPQWYLDKTDSLINDRLNGKTQSIVQRYTGIPANTVKSLPIRVNLRKGSRLQFTTEIASWGNYEIGFSTQENGGGTKYNRFFITTNSVTAYTHYDYMQSAMYSESVAHNLEISSGTITTIIEELDDAKCRLTILNNGNIYEHTFENWVRNNILCPYFIAPYSIFGNSVFSWSCSDLKKDIWLFGDSYMAYEQERWAYYLAQYGYDDNVLISAFPGAGSATALVSIEALADYGTPKFAVWVVGMNDGSDSSSEPVSAWATARDSFLEICAENDIIPVFGTIPTVPTVNNEQKNAWIRSSGYRYIDFAKAVLANSSGIWGTGMLSSDGVHPTVNGARALFGRALTDFPELMISE